MAESKANKKALNGEDFKDYRGLLTEEEFKKALDQRDYDDDILRRAIFIKSLADQEFFKPSSQAPTTGRPTGNMMQIFTDLLIKHDPKRVHPTNLKLSPWNSNIVQRAYLRFRNLFLDAINFNDPQAAFNLYERTSNLPQTETTQQLLIEGYQIDGELIPNHDNLSICFDKNLVPHVMKESVKSEIDRMSKLPTTFKSKYIVNYTLITVHGKHFFIMPMYPVTMEPVKKLIGDNLQRFWKQMFDALNALHDAKYAHMDIKPSNICVDAEGNFILIDLGSVAEFDTTSESTPAYIPSDFEIKKVSARIDWLMLAATLSEKIQVLNWGTGSASPTIGVLAKKLEENLPPNIWTQLEPLIWAP